MNVTSLSLIVGFLALPISLYAQSEGQTEGQTEDKTEGKASGAVAEVAKNVDLDPDLEAMQGKWKLLAMEAAGNPAPPQIVATMKYEFKGDILIVTPTEPGQSDHRIKLNSAAKPIPTFDMTPLVHGEARDTLQGIYVMKGDKLKICLGMQARPTAFTANKEDGYGQVMILLQRE